MSDLINGISVRIRNAFYREEGQALTEYAILLAAIVGIVALASFTGIGASIGTKITKQLAKF